MKEETVFFYQTVKMSDVQKSGFEKKQNHVFQQKKSNSFGGVLTSLIKSEIKN